MKDSTGDFFKQEDVTEQRRARHRRRERRRAVLVMLGSLVVMVAVLYATVTVCVWMDRKMQTNANGVGGPAASGVNAPEDGEGSVPGGSDGSGESVPGSSDGTK